MIKFILNKLKEYNRLYQHKKAWRACNRHNFTIALGFFPINKVKVGNHSYGDLKIINYGEENEGLEIKNYVSIANGVQFLLGGNHYYKRFTTYPIQAKFVSSEIVETWSKGKIVVNDDVWIGTEAFIMAGVTIGQGAIIGARAVVTQDIPPYAIAAGNPAKVVKYRFTEAQIKQLLLLDYSKITPQQILANKALYEQESVTDELVEYFTKEKNI
jgi:acetyltransferase-like isoleucine patch superfamily enzyme